jgi:hypothetical protein
MGCGLLEKAKESGSDKIKGKKEKVTQDQELSNLL